MAKVEQTAYNKGKSGVSEIPLMTYNRYYVNHFMPVEDFTGPDKGQERTVILWLA